MLMRACVRLCAGGRRDAIFVRSRVHAVLDYVTRLNRSERITGCPFDKYVNYVLYLVILILAAILKFLECTVDE